MCRTLQQPEPKGERLIFHSIKTISGNIIPYISDDKMGKLFEQQRIIQEKLDAMDAWELDSRLDYLKSLQTGWLCC